MIDHIAVSQSFYPYWEETAIFNELLPDKSIAFATTQKFPESDHAPVVAHFCVPDSWIP
jgi:exonuclease III